MDEIQKALQGRRLAIEDNIDSISKGIKLPNGTIRKRPNGNFIKTPQGWKYHSSANTPIGRSNTNLSLDQHEAKVKEFHNKKPSSDSVDDAINQAGKTSKPADIAQAKKVAAAYGMSDKNINEAIATSKQAYKEDAAKKTAKKAPKIPDARKVSELGSIVIPIGAVINGTEIATPVYRDDKGRWYSRSYGDHSIALYVTDARGYGKFADAKTKAKAAGKVDHKKVLGDHIDKQSSQSRDWDYDFTAKVSDGKIYVETHVNGKRGYDADAERKALNRKPRLPEGYEYKTGKAVYDDGSEMTVASIKKRAEDYDEGYSDSELYGSAKWQVVKKK